MSKDIIVTVNDGKIQGTRQASPFFPKEFYSFFGIPYAEPPVGKLRFRDPIKVKPWKSIRNADIEKEGCSQFSLICARIMGSEDCLYVNIHTPKLPSTNDTLKAVVALIHPGGLLWGSPDSSQHGSPHFVMNRDVVYVTIGYRINIFGFLNLEMKECSGNQGLKDIVMALKWIKDNIQHFNGDPRNVTIMGTSSGASLVHILMLSPAAKDLFHKAIIMGNYALNCSVVHPQDQIKLAYEYVKPLGYKGRNTKQLLSFLKKLPAIQIVQSIRVFQDEVAKDVVRAAFGAVFNLVTDQGEQAVLPASPRDFVSSMERVPLICGICERETIIAFTHSSMESTEKHFHRSYRQNCWAWPYTLTDHEVDQMQQEINSFYSGKVPDADTPLAVKDAILTDASFSEMYDTLIDPISAELPSSTFVYKFQYEGDLNASRITFHPFMVEKFPGAYHFDDFCYWAPMLIPPTPDSLSMMNLITKLFTNFAKTGDPNFEDMEVRWRPSTTTEPCYLSINNTLTMTDGKLNKERWEFWDTLKKRYFRDSS